MYAAVSLDAILEKVLEPQAANRPSTPWIEVSPVGDRDVLRPSAGQGGEGAKFWISVLTDLHNGRTKDTFSVSARASRTCRRWSATRRAANVQTWRTAYPSDPQHSVSQRDPRTVAALANDALTGNAVFEPSQLSGLVGHGGYHVGRRSGRCVGAGTARTMMLSR